MTEEISNSSWTLENTFVWKKNIKTSTKERVPRPPNHEVAMFIFDDSINIQTTVVALNNILTTFNNLTCVAVMITLLSVSVSVWIRRRTTSGICPTGSGETLVEFLEGWFEAPYCNCMHHWIFQMVPILKCFHKEGVFKLICLCVYGFKWSSVIGYSYNVFGFTVTESLWFN